MTLDDEVRAAAAELERGAADSQMLARIRAGAARFDPVELAPGDVRSALNLLREHTEIDAAVPVASARREIAYVKRGLRRLLGWYMAWFAHQVTLLGQAVARFGQAVSERFEQLERRVDDHERGARRDFDALAARVAQLEAAERRRQRGEP